MPYDSRTYRILIASPSDVEEEREIAVKVIQQWNDLYSYTRGVVLLPLRWETHSAPEYGARPQEVINRAIVDNCDLLVGIFWTRVGTPTGVSDSGTLEEISRVAKAGKPIMLYFSKIGKDPEDIDTDQLNRLKDFRAETYVKGLTESYKSHIDFRDKFARQLELKVNDLQKAHASGQPPPLTLRLGSEDLKLSEGSAVKRIIDIPEVINLEDSDIYHSETGRKSIEAYLNRAAITPVVLAICNTGSSGIRNLYFEMQIHSPPGVIITTADPRPPGDATAKYLVEQLRQIVDRSTSEKRDYEVDILKAPPPFKLPEVGSDFAQSETGSRFSFEWTALQPQRVRFVKPPLFIKALADAHIEFVTKVFADSLPAPAEIKASLEIVVNKRKMEVEELMGEMGVAPSQSAAPRGLNKRNA